MAQKKILTTLVSKHVSKHEIKPTEQRAVRKGVRGCSEALWVDYVVVMTAKQSREIITTRSHIQQEKKSSMLIWLNCGIV